MNSEIFPLVAVAVSVFAFGFVILRRFLPTWAAIGIAAVKAAIPFIYFAVYFESSGWTLRDDMHYFGVGAGLLQLGYRPWELLLDPEGRDVLASAAASRHTLYYLWNVVAESIVGLQYYSAVFFNVGLTFVTGAMIFTTLRCLAMPVRFCQGVLAFQMLHWDYLSWVSFINIKESLVELLVVTSIFCILRFVRSQTWPAILGLAGSFLLLFSLRLYVPFLIMAAVGTWLLLQSRDARKWLLLPPVVGVLGLLYLQIGDYDQVLYPYSIMTGAVRFVLTPQPWNITPSYSFLQIPMTLQWLFAVPALVGGWMLWQQHRECRLLLLVLVVFVAFYAMFEAHQGPRHRVQLVALFSLVECQFLSAVYRALTLRGLHVRRQMTPWLPGVVSR